MKHKPFTILIHLALAVILAGAFVTHFFGIQGTLTLQKDSMEISHFEKSSGPGNGEFPFSVRLIKTEIIYYPETSTPMDFRSIIEIDGKYLNISMNKVGDYNNWRFYQAGIGSDSSVLSVSHDPWGIAITYIGYGMLCLGMLGFFFQKHSVWRIFLKRYRLGFFALMFLNAMFPSDVFSDTPDTSVHLRVMQRPLASNFGKVLVYWNDRICPIQTLALDVTRILYDGTSYRGYTPEQVLSGWLFYYDQWQRDYISTHPELKTVNKHSVNKEDKKIVERLAIVEWLGTGEIFRIYPFQAVDGHYEWLSLTGRRPSGMSLEQWTFMQRTMPHIKELLLKGKNLRANEELYKLKEDQRKYSKDLNLPSDNKINAERFYNKFIAPGVSGIISLISGLFVLYLASFRSYRKIWRVVSSIFSILLFTYVAVSIGLLWWISNHIPLSNGPETMMFMAFASLLGACIFNNLTLRGAFLIVSAISMFVAGMGGRTPAIGAMLPVLSSPLLSVHVMLVMLAYTLFFLIAVLSALAIGIRNVKQSRRLTALNFIILTPAVFLLGAGIFVGAVWANQTWGRYWGWDPKETCALLMWVIYAVPIHRNNRYLQFLRKDSSFNLYLFLAILTVLFTYFGANYFLGGLHSYA